MIYSRSGCDFLSKTFSVNFAFKKISNTADFLTSLNSDLPYNVCGSTSLAFYSLLCFHHRTKAKANENWAFTHLVSTNFLTNSERFFGWNRNQVTTLTSLYTTQYSLDTTLHFINCSVRHIVLNSLLFHSNNNNVKMFVVLLGTYHSWAQLTNNVASANR